MPPIEKVVFNYEQKSSPVFGKVNRPVAKVSIHNRSNNLWTEIWMLVDSGADYTILPRYMAKDLGVTLEKDCKVLSTMGVGGYEKVYFLSKLRVKIGKWEREIPAGFLERSEIPPLMGRHLFLETFDVLLSSKKTISFSNPN